jgi:CubicO group peptidase (beta-lactamase class C family)
MRRALACSTATLLLLLGCSADRERGSASATSSTDRPFDCEADLGRPLARWSEVGFSGAAAASSGRGEVCTGGFGAVAGADTVFDIGSVTKTMTATAVVSLVEDGTLTLDDAAGRWLAELPDPVGAVTVRQLLTHTAGLGEAHGPDEVAMTLDQALAVIGAQELLFEPGDDVSYSNSGYTLLAAIVERASGRPFREYLVDEVLTLPDGSVAGGFWSGEPTTVGPRAPASEDAAPGGPGDVGPHWAMEGNGGVAMSVRQLHAWTRALAAGEIIPPGSVAQMAEPQVEVDEGALTFGWGSVDPDVFGGRALASLGGGGSVGHDVALFWLPDAKQVVVLASNGEGVTAEHLAPATVSALVAGDAIPGPVEPVPTGPDQLAALSGTYGLDDGSDVEVVVDGDRLVVSATGGTALVALFPPPPDVGEDAVTEHERLVEDLLAGTSSAGQTELELLEHERGALMTWEVRGTGAWDGELRTYVDLQTDGGPTTAWFALDDLGGVAGVEYDPTLPTSTLVPVADGTFVPAATVADDEPAVALRFSADASEVELVSWDRSVTATRR